LLLNLNAKLATRVKSSLPCEFDPASGQFTVKDASARGSLVGRNLFLSDLFRPKRDKMAMAGTAYRVFVYG